MKFKKVVCVQRNFPFFVGVVFEKVEAEDKPDLNLEAIVCKRGETDMRQINWAHHPVYNVAWTNPSLDMEAN